MSLDGLLDLSGLQGTEAASETERLAAGEPWFATEVAGLQFYAYGSTDELTGERIIPQPGDRLHLVREPANPHYSNAIEVWWRNAHMLGHLPRYAAYHVAPLLDAGAAARAYVAQPGDGEAWTLEALIVGPAASEIHESNIRHIAHLALGPSEREQKRAKRLERRASRAVEFNAARREARLRQAVETLFRAPFEPDLPAVGETVSTGRLMDALQCCDKTIVRIAATVGITVTRYRDTYDWVTVTPELVEALRAWAKAPRGRIDVGYVYIPRVYAERERAHV